MLRREVSLGLMTQGSLFASALPDEGRERLVTDHGLEVTLLGQPALLVHGAAGVHLFYDTDRMERRDAMPAAIAGLLFGPGAVHGLDGDEHRQRKGTFLDVLDPSACGRLADEAGRGWRRWAAAQDGDGGSGAEGGPGGEANVVDGASTVFLEAVLTWCGAPAADDRLRRDLLDVLDGFGAIGPRQLRARVARRRVDAWATEQVRRARLDAASTPDSPLRRLATARDAAGRLLPETTAAVELVNLVRPTVAVSYLASFAALALVEHPGWRRRLQDAIGAEDPRPVVAFAHEVRRYFPFVPMLAARARHDLDWQGFHVPRGRRVLLDVYGTNHGAGWVDPWAFRPERFLDQDPLTLAWFVPQGGGRPETGHRCPGEGVTGALLVETLRALVDRPLRLDVDDTAWSRRRVPARPPSGVRVGGGRP